MMKYYGGVITIVVTVWNLSCYAQAQKRSVCAVVTRTNIVRCALQGSPAVYASEQAIAAARGRQMAAKPLLPSNPIVSFSAGRRGAGGLGSGADVTNWYVTLAQEVEIANQRGARRDVAFASLSAEQHRRVIQARDVVSAAWVAYFGALAAKEKLALAQRLEVIGKGIAEVAVARAEQGLVASIEAELAEALSLRVSQVRIEADKQVQVTHAVLTTQVGRSVKQGIDVQGHLEPIPTVQRLVQSDRSINEAPEIHALLAQSAAHKASASVYRRSRVPNPTLSGFIQNDGFNEQVLGMGIQIPIPLPQPIGRTYAGQIAEAEALSKQAQREAEQLQRELLVRLQTAIAEYNARQAQVELFTQARIERAESALSAIAQEVKSGRLGLRDALLTEQGLVSLLQDYVEAKTAWCLSSVELARAAGLALEEGVP